MSRNPGWKARAQAERRAAAEERQKIYDALSPAEKLKRAGARVRLKLIKGGEKASTEIRSEKEQAESVGQTRKSKPTKTKGQR